MTKKRLSRNSIRQLITKAIPKAAPKQLYLGETICKASKVESPRLAPIKSVESLIHLLFLGKQESAGIDNP